MNTFGECSHSYNEENSYDEMAHTVCEVGESKKQSSFETLTAADIITLMNEYIEDVESILGVSFIVGIFTSIVIRSKDFNLIFLKLVADNNDSHSAKSHKMG